MNRKSLTDRQKAALTVLRNEARFVHPARVARLLDGPGKSGAGWRATLDALERLDLVKGMYQSPIGGRSFAITRKGLEALSS